MSDSDANTDATPKPTAAEGDPSEDWMDWDRPAPDPGARLSADPAAATAEPAAEDQSAPSMEDRIRRIYRYLTEPSPGPRIEGVDVSRERLEQFVKYLKDRASGTGGLAQRAERLLAFLTEDIGTEMAGEVNVARLRMMLNGARRRLGIELERQRLLDLPAAMGQQSAQLSLEQVQSVLGDLVTAVQQLQHRLEQAEIRAGDDDAEVVLPREPREEGARASEEWYDEFLR